MELGKIMFKEIGQTGFPHSTIDSIIFYLILIQGAGWANLASGKKEHFRDKFQFFYSWSPHYNGACHVDQHSPFSALTCFNKHFFKTGRKIIPGQLN